jgi:hypothetical protein
MIGCSDPVHTASQATTIALSTLSGFCIGYGFHILREFPMDCTFAPRCAPLVLFELRPELGGG